MIKSALQSTPVQLPISVLKRTILLVEHNGVIRTIIAHMLREIGSNVIEAFSADHAINLLQTSLLSVVR